MEEFKNDIETKMKIAFEREKKIILEDLEIKKSSLKELTSKYGSLEENFKNYINNLSMVI